MVRKTRQVTNDLSWKPALTFFRINWKHFWSLTRDHRAIEWEDDALEEGLNSDEKECKVWVLIESIEREVSVLFHQAQPSTSPRLVWSYRSFTSRSFLAPAETGWHSSTFLMGLFTATIHFLLTEASLTESSIGEWSTTTHSQLSDNRSQHCGSEIDAKLKVLEQEVNHQFAPGLIIHISFWQNCLNNWVF